MESEIRIAFLKLHSSILKAASIAFIFIITRCILGADEAWLKLLFSQLSALLLLQAFTWIEYKFWDNLESEMNFLAKRFDSTSPENAAVIFVTGKIVGKNRTCFDVMIIFQVAIAGLLVALTCAFYYFVTDKSIIPLMHKAFVTSAVESIFAIQAIYNYVLFLEIWLELAITSTEILFELIRKIHEAFARQPNTCYLLESCYGEEIEFQGVSFRPEDWFIAAYVTQLVDSDDGMAFCAGIPAAIQMHQQDPIGYLEGETHLDHNNNEVYSGENQMEEVI